MPWPTPQDYSEAVQTPHLSFSDPALMAGQPELTRLGLPRPIAGNFASVYRIQSGARDWAVRCFLRQFSDQQERYEAISRHLTAARLPYTVGFDYLPRGIRVGGRWYPILKMEWLQGDTLGEYVEKHAGTPAALHKLATQWEEMLRRLHQHGVAHGDLQHDNVLVVNHQLRLIDYDGMYVPTLKGRPSNETGHRNYQHPRRSEWDFGLEMDNFSAWVVYLSFVAMGAEPSLWQRFRGEEQLLFRKEDFEHPDASQVLLALGKSQDARLQAISALFSSFVRMDVTAIPALDSRLLAGVGKPQVTVPGAVPRPNAASVWWKELLNGAPPPARKGAVSPAAGGIAGAWAPAQPQVPASLGMPSTPERVFIWLAPACHVVSAVLALTGGVTSLALGLLVLGELLLLGLAVRYRQRPEVQAKAQVTKHLTLLDAEAVKLEEELKRLQSKRDDLNREDKEKTSQVEANLRDVQQKEQEQLAQVDAELQRQLASLQAQLTSLKQGESAELSQALKDLQNRALVRFLAQHTIAGASIAGIGPTYTKRLASAGILTAADFVDIDLSFSNYGGHQSEKACLVLPGGRKTHVEGVGPKKAQSLLAWRKTLAAQYRSDVPQSLPPPDQAVIRAKYEAQRRQLGQQEADARTRFRQRRDQMQAGYRQSRASLTAQLDGIRARIDQSRAGLDQSMQNIRQELSRKQHERTVTRARVDTYREVHLWAYLKRLITG